MAWLLGTITNNYSQPVGVQVFTPSAGSVDYSAGPISGGNINIIIPLKGTLSFVDLGRVPGSVPPLGVDVFFLDDTWSLRYATTLKVNVTIDATGTPTLQQV